MNIETTTRNPTGVPKAQIVFSNQEEKYPTTSKRLVTIRDVKKPTSVREYGLLVRQLIRQTITEKNQTLSIIFDDINCENLFGSRTDLLESLARNITMASYQFTRYQSDSGQVLETVYLVGDFAPEEKKSVAKGSVVGCGINFSRDLSNTPAADMSPQDLADVAVALAQNNTKTTIEIFGPDEIKQLGLGLLSAVGQGSTRPAQFISVLYQGTNKTSQPVVLVGKGVTFDTGGLNIKPTGGIEGMHLDMSGAAACLGALQIVQNLKLKINLRVIIPATDNVVSGGSYCPGDILTSLSGKTVFVGNTDAEGRLILADALTYTQQFNPQLVIDVATLTGSAIAALGRQASAVFSYNNNLLSQVKTAGELVDSRVWPMPLYDEYKALLKNDFADLNNIGPEKWGDGCIAATFLGQFIGQDIPWVHIDMAPRETSVEGDYLAPGATGEPTALLVELVRQQIRA